MLERLAPAIARRSRGRHADRQRLSGRRRGWPESAPGEPPGFRVERVVEEGVWRAILAGGRRRALAVRVPSYRRPTASAAAGSAVSPPAGAGAPPGAASSASSVATTSCWPRRGRDFEVEITALLRAPATAARRRASGAPPEPALELTLYQSLIRPKRFDLVLEKGAELGVARFVPVVSGRAQVKTEGGSSAGGTLAADRHGGGGAVRPRPRPGRRAAVPFAEAVRTAPGLRLLPYEGERSWAWLVPARREAAAREAVSLFIGPEGGFSAEEAPLPPRGRLRRRLARPAHPALGDGWHRRLRARHARARRAGASRTRRGRPAYRQGGSGRPRIVPEALSLGREGPLPRRQGRGGGTCDHLRSSAADSGVAGPICDNLCSSVAKRPTTPAAPVSSSIGSTRTPWMRASQCRWSPLTKPVAPT